MRVMSQVRRRVAAVLFTVTLAAGVAIGCGASDTLLAITFSPDSTIVGDKLQQIHFKLSTGTSEKKGSTLKEATVDVTPNSDLTKSPPAFYQRYVFNGKEGKVTIQATGLDQDGKEIESGEADGEIFADEAAALTVNLKAPAADTTSTGAGGGGAGAENAGAAGASSGKGGAAGSGDSSGSSGSAAGSKGTGGEQGGQGGEGGQGGQAE